MDWCRSFSCNSVKKHVVYAAVCVHVLVGELSMLAGVVKLVVAFLAQSLMIFKLHHPLRAERHGNQVHHPAFLFLAAFLGGNPPQIVSENDVIAGCSLSDRLILFRLSLS